jgi:hypothetical protein
MTAADVLGLASLAVALVALVVSAIAIRRDRAYLVVRATDAAAGSRFTTVVNVGLRPIRIVRVVTRPRRWTLWVTPTDLTDWSGIAGDDGGARLPVVLDPGAEVVLWTPNPAMLGLPDGPFAVIDASERFHWPTWRATRLVTIPRPETPEDREDTGAS